MPNKRSRNKKGLSYWLVLGLANSLRVLTWLPLSLQITLGRKLGHLLMKRSPKMHRVARKNIELCFEHLSAQEQQQLLSTNFENVGIGVFESLNSAWLGPDKLAPMLASISGLEPVLAAREQGKSVVFLFPHMIPMYLIGHLVSLKTGIPMSLMYNSPKNAALNDFIHNRLAPHTQAVYTRKDIRQMIKDLKQGGRCVWYAPDLDIGRAQSEFAPFFGHPASTLTAPIRIAQLTDALFFPIGFYREDNRYEYTVNIYPALSHFPSNDALRDLTQINRTVEQIVKQKPAQYLWPYKRFNTRPPGEKKLYTNP